ncbi:SMI1/KNR4 family protein [Neisseria sp. 74A18]|uniref:SMI1/KNR4 family protein n=1 Tax=Neisseria sp. 74A18 TaxID=1696094 RepID=UPI0006CE8B31|nr:SMI1/KNR4 family protein [Neisseria sp. 74A18]KPN72755.1 1,3-beta-glucan synthase regulator [Neisseria sp. 74A18]
MVKFLKLGKSEEEIKILEQEEGKLSKKAIKHYLFLNKNSMVSSKVISKFEKENNISLPSEYIEFLKIQNGGIPKENCFSNGKVLNFFFGLFENQNVEESIEWHLNMYEGRYPSSMLPIASAGGGDLILLGIAGEYNSKIYYWDHNFEAEESGTDYFENIEFIANNLKDFLGILSDNQCT